MTHFDATLLIAAALLARAAQSLLAAGAARSRFAATAFSRNLVDLAFGALLLWLVGQTGLLGADVFTVVATLLVVSGLGVGAIAERSRLRLVVIQTAIFALVLIPAAALFTAQTAGLITYIDSTGLGTTALLGSAMAIASAAVIGPRSRKYNKDGSANFIMGHHLPMATLGALLLVLAVSLHTLARLAGTGIDAPAATLLLCFAGAIVGAMAYGGYTFRRIEPLYLIQAAVASAVAVTPAAAMPEWVAVVLGLLVGVAAPWLASALDMRLRIDDASHLAAPVLGGALAGLMAAAFIPLTPDDSFAIRPGQLLGVATIAVIGLALSWGLMRVAAALTPLRSSDADEYDGLDIAELDVNAYPDFQQNTIKSFHLREA